MPRSEKAEEIAEAMGIFLIREDSDCLTCHFTSAIKDGEVTPIAGITCESCHGAGKDWIKVHSDYGGKGVTRETEDPANKKDRLEKSGAAGMIRPVRLYALAQNCYSCHTVPNEKLVNKGGHPAGSKFELVRWSQGEVRHNVQYTKENGEAPLERRRMMYIVGRILDLEFALRGVAKATKNANYAKTMAKRTKVAKKRIQQIAEVVDAPEITAILAIADKAKLKLNSEGPLTTAANEVATEAKKLAANHDGSQFSGIDALLPAPDKYKGKVHK